jgi:hypothetical protein
VLSYLNFVVCYNRMTKKSRSIARPAAVVAHEEEERHGSDAAQAKKKSYSKYASVYDEDSSDGEK